MRTKRVIGLLTVAAIPACVRVAGIQTAAAALKMQLPSAETVWDSSE